MLAVSTRLCVCVSLQYGHYSLEENIPVGYTVLTLQATDADEPDSGSSRIEFLITAGNDGDIFSVETDGSGVGHLVIAQVKDSITTHFYL